MRNPRLGRPYLSVVVPAYNEEKRLGGSLEKIGAYLDTNDIDAEIIVVDDGSSDATERIAAGLLRGRRGKVLRNVENRGKGHSVRRGTLESSGRWVLLTDADLSSPIEEHSKLALAVREHDLDVAIGSRALPESDIKVRQAPLREAMGKIFNRIIRLGTGLRFRDTQCGFKLYDLDRTRPLFERMVVDRFAFDVEFLFLAVRYGLAVREVPVVWADSKGSKVGIVTSPINMVWDLLRVRWRFRRGLYNPETRPDGKPA
ncbi:MAG: glycosyltransferase family 2 protein [Acidobacteriota bacterium]|nr:glycosyltransferase family 2 protein [Acidobacteriota bacterium]